MEKFIITDGQIKIDEISYEVKTIDTSTLVLKNDIKTTEQKPVKNEKGVYIFVLKKDIPSFNIKCFDKELTGIFFENNCPYAKTIGVPPYIDKIKKDCIFYIGSAGKIVSRLKEHWNNSKINGCTSLKLGFSSRKWIRQFLTVYIIASSYNNNLDHKQLESTIRKKFGASFGK